VVRLRRELFVTLVDGLLLDLRALRKPRGFDLLGSDPGARHGQLVDDLFDAEQLERLGGVAMPRRWLGRRGNLRRGGYARCRAERGRWSQR
jgi:hypothetical protein